MESEADDAEERVSLLLVRSPAGKFTRENEELDAEELEDCGDVGMQRNGQLVFLQ